MMARAFAVKTECVRKEFADARPKSLGTGRVATDVERSSLPGRALMPQVSGNEVAAARRFWGARHPIVETAI
jgi:hypothetical protein